MSLVAQAKRVSHDALDNRPKRFRDKDFEFDSDDETAFLRRRKREKRTVNIKRNLRLPQVLFAASLEGVLMVLWKSKSFADFLYPVDAAAVPKYYSDVKEPICLSDIRDNLGK